jgi:putative ABC transport system permease protein
MFFLRLALTAARSLETHFLRSLLATVGVLIGVGSVVACMAILEGASNEIVGNLSKLGSSTLYIRPAVARVEGRSVGQAQSLVIDDATLLKRELGDDIKLVSTEALGQAVVKYFQKSDTYTILATSDTYFQINEYKAAQGRVFIKTDVDDELALVCLLGSQVAEKLFGGTDAVGQSVKIRNTAYRVVGVMEKRGNIGFLNADEIVYIPIKSGLKRFFNRTWLSWMSVQSVSAEKIEELQKKVKPILRKAHNIRVGQPDDFEMFTQEQIIREVNSFTLIFKLVFYSIAGISLVVGGIGIMNIMLVSVTERTREIGVRMAVGAHRLDILFQFLVEALIISVLGGGFGLLLGMMFADLLDKVFQGVITTQINVWIVVVALGVTTIVGIFSGLYPAFKASRLDPVEALRYE